MSALKESRITFPQLFSQFDRVEIPIIQRDYAQGRETAIDVRSGLLDAIFEALDRDPDDPALPLDLDFVYGSISKTRQDDLETVAFAPLDGQQRLTTLFLLHWFAAWADGASEAFKRLYREGDKSRFAYLVRPSGTEFFDTLSGFFPNPDHVGESILSDFLEEQPWFFLYWKQDPTIQSALVMLDSIQERFGKARGLYPKLADEARPRIAFQFLDLEQFGLSDDLYIKMNARGKPLTAFENFKAKLEQKLASDFPDWEEEGEAGKTSVKHYFSHRIETRWADLFWHFRDPKSRLFDDKVMALYRELAIVTRDPDDDGFEDVVKDLRKRREGLTYQWFAKTGAIDGGILRCLFGTLDRLSGSDNGMTTFLDDSSYLDEQALFQKALDPRTTLNFEESALLRAYTGYLADHRAGINAASLWNWGRVVANLSRNTIYNRPEDFRRSLRSLNALFDHVDSILERLADHAGEIAGFNQQQAREEQLKAQLILKSNDWRELILEAECHRYFAGQIEFLLKFSGVLDRWVDAKTCDWSEAEDEEFRSSFQSYLQRAKLIFEDQGLRSFDGFLWERALLAEGDYLVESGRNHCFLRSEGRDIAWKRLLRGDPKKREEETRRNIVARVMDQLDPDRDVKQALQDIVDRAKVDDPWRKLFIEHPETIEYCEDRLIRWESKERIYLLKRSQLNGHHVDLFTYCLFLGEVDSMVVSGELRPFTTAEYRQVKHTRTEPGIVLQAVIGTKQVKVEILNSVDDDARYVIGIPRESDLFLETKVWPAVGALGFLEVERIDETTAMELVVERGDIIEKLREVGACLKALES